MFRHSILILNNIKNARLARRKDHSLVLNIKGQRNSISNNCLDVLYLFIIQVII